MIKDYRILTIVLFVVAQMLLSNYALFTPFVMLGILPAVVLCITPKAGTVLTMLIAFAMGLAVDLLAEGTLGINALSLVPIALIRRPLIEAICGNEPFENKEPISIKKYGFSRISLAIIIVCAIFTAIYTIADCAGTRPFWFILAKTGASTMASYVVSILIVHQLTNDYRR